MERALSHANTDYRLEAYEVASTFIKATETGMSVKAVLDEEAMLVRKSKIVKNSVHCKKKFVLRRRQHCITWEHRPQTQESL